MNCPKCGNPISPNTKFCAKCGTPVPQKSPVQTTYPQNNPQTVQRPQPAQRNAVNPQQQKPPAPQSFVTPQPTPPNVAIKSPKPPRKKKSNKNLPLIIVAAVLVLAVLVSTIAVVPGIIRNKNEINAATEYIEEFPTLKQKTSLLVYDINKFPSEKYEIKVERMFMGGVLNGVFKGKTILEDVSTEQIYDIDFKEDGDYRITLTDKTDKSEENTGSTSENKTEVIEIIIIIDVKVDNDAEDSVDNVDLNAGVTEEITEPSEQDSANKFLEATDEDFRELEMLLESVSMPNEYNGEKWGEFNYKAENALFEASSQVLGVFNWLFGYYDKYFGWNSDWSVVTPEYTGEEVFTKSYDPLKKYIYDYMYFPADKVDWIFENVFNVKPQHTEIYNETDAEKWLASYYYEGYYYVDTGDGGWYSPKYRIEKFEKQTDGTYKMLIRSGYEGDFENSYDLYEIVAGVKEYEGKRYWSFYSISLHKEIPTDALEFNGHYYKLYDMTGKTWQEAQNYCESLGGHLATITSQEEQDFVQGMIPSQTNSRLYWLGSYYTYNKWIWVTGETFDYSNWAPGEPSGGQNYMTVLGSYFNENTGKWLDNPEDGCSEPWTLSATAFICEWD